MGRVSFVLFCFFPLFPQIEHHHFDLNGRFRATPPSMRNWRQPPVFITQPRTRRGAALMGRQSDGEENRTEDRRLRCQLGFLSQT